MHPAYPRCAQVAAVVLATTAASACAPEGLPHYGRLAYDSDNFEVYASKGLQACGGTYEFTEQWLSAFRARVGDYSAREPHTFYWLTPEEYGASPCSENTIGCAFSRSAVIYSARIPLEHEIVHVELGRVARPPSLFIEGVAEAFGSIDAPDYTEIAAVEAYADEELVPGYGYETSGRFTRFVIDRFGLDAYFDLYVALDGKAGLPAIETAIADVLGVEFSTLNAEFKAVNCSIDRWRFYDYECGALPLTPWESKTRWSADIDLSCDNDDVLGPRRGIESRKDTDFIWTLRAFEVGDADVGPYRMTIESTDRSAVATIFECGITCTDPGPVQPASLRTASVAAGGASTVLALTAGRYWVRIEHNADSDAPVHVSIE